MTNNAERDVKIGPEVTIKKSCFNCKVCTSESYRCQSDSGSDVYCSHPAFKDMPSGRKRIGDTTWETPEWCPAKTSAKASGVPDEVRLALQYSRNYAKAAPYLNKTCIEHMEGLCDLLERVSSPTPPESASVPVERLEALREVWGSSANERYAIGGEFCSGEAHVYEVCEE